MTQTPASPVATNPIQRISTRPGPACAFRSVQLSVKLANLHRQAARRHVTVIVPGMYHGKSQIGWTTLASKPLMTADATAL
jgi:hypothetical protein